MSMPFEASLHAPMLALAMATPGWAQTQTNDAVVVTATKLPAQISSVPSAITVVTGSDLRTRGTCHLWRHQLRGRHPCDSCRSRTYGGCGQRYGRHPQQLAGGAADGLPGSDSLQQSISINGERRGFSQDDARVGTAHLLYRAALDSGPGRWHADVAATQLRLDGTNLTDRRDPVAESELGDAQFYRPPGRMRGVSLSTRL